MSAKPTSGAAAKPPTEATKTEQKPTVKPAAATAVDPMTATVPGGIAMPAPASDPTAVPAAATAAATAADPAATPKVAGQRPRPGAGPQRPAIQGGPPRMDHMGRYLDMLGVGPGATLDEISTAYFSVVKGFPENPTEEDEARMQELRHAFDVVRRRYVPPKAKGFKILFDKRVVLPLMGVGLLALVGTFLWMNWNNVKLQMTHYEPGAELRLKSAATPFGTVVGYESIHTFPAGIPSPAYSIKLADKEETVWVSERLVVIGMVPTGK